MTEQQIYEAIVWFGAAAATVLVPYAASVFLRQRWLGICAAIWAAAILLAYLFTGELGIQAVSAMSIVMATVLAITGIIWIFAYMTVNWLVPAWRWIVRLFTAEEDGSAASEDDRIDYLSRNNDLKDFSNFAG